MSRCVYHSYKQTVNTMYSLIKKIKICLCIINKFKEQLWLDSRIVYFHAEMSNVHICSRKV